MESAVGRSGGRSIAKVSGGDGSQTVAADRGSFTRRRRRGNKQREEVETESSSSRQQNATSAGKYVVPNDVDTSIVVLLTYNDRDKMTSGQDSDYDDDKLEASTVEVPAVVGTGFQEEDERLNTASQDHNDSAMGVLAFGNVSDAADLARNVSLPPLPPDQKYVDTVFKIAHIFHFVGIGILAFFVLQVDCLL